MKILVIPSWYPPKGGQFFQQYAEWLAEHGNDVSVLSFNEYSLKEFSLKQQDVFSDKHLTVYEKKFWRIPKLRDANERRFIKQYIRFATKKIQEIQPDIIHAHSVCWGGYVAYQLHLKTNIPYVITEHRGRFLQTPHTEGFIKPWHLPLIKNALSFSKRNLAVSSALAAGLEELGDKQCAVTPNALPLAFLRDADAQKSAIFQFVAVGALVDYKGFDLLLEAVSILQSKSTSPFTLKIAGKGNKLKELKAYISQNDLRDVVTLLGQVPQEDIKQLLSESHVLLSTSRFEAFGVNIIEAQSQGLPVIATKSGGPSDLVNEKTGILVDLNAKSIARGMERIMKEYDLFDRDFIELNVLKKYQPNKVYKDVVNVLKEVVNEHPNAN